MFLAFVGIALIFWMFQPEPKTPEQLTAEAELIRAEAEADAVRIAAEEEARQKEEAERQRIREEEHRRHLEEEAAKTPEQKAIEAQNEEMSIAEGAAAVAGIGAAAYIFGKMLDGI